MGRIVTVLVAAALAGSLFLLPTPDPLRLAAIGAFSDPVAENNALLDEPIGPGAPTLGELVLDGPAVQPVSEGVVRLQLGGVRIASTTVASEDLEIHGTARRALVRGLREYARRRDLALEVVGELAPNSLGGAHFMITVEPGTIAVTHYTDRDNAVTVQRDWRPPRRGSLAPPVIAILLAILLRRPALSLFAGVWAATYLMRRAGGAEVLGSLAGGLPDVATELFWPKFRDPSNAMIVGFVIAMLSMVGVMTKSGGIRGLMDAIAKLASGVRSTQFTTYLMGLAVFFDDYANTILVGTTMRPLTDRMRVAREKLAYIVDSTAAPVAGLSIFSTWIAFEVSTFSPQLPSAGLLPSDGYAIFIESLPYRFYCILTLVLVPIIALSGRDFGPMLTAERRARTRGLLVREGGRPMVGNLATGLQPSERVRPAAARAILPLLVFVGLTLFEILRVGGAFGMSAAELFTLRGLTNVLYEGSGSYPILVGSLGGLAVATVQALAAGLRGEIFRAAWTVLRSMGIALVILYLAWMIGLACQQMGTASYLTALLGERLTPALLPALLFLVSAAVAFATGSSWGTMSILLPLVVGLSFALGEQAPGLGGHLLMVMTIGAVLEGSIFGDHCSPISDTTVLSSTASASDHIDHVRTQAPYAIVTMLVALVFGYVPCALLNWNPLLGLVLGATVLLLVVRTFGRHVEPGGGAADPVETGTGETG